MEFKCHARYDTARSSRKMALKLFYACFDTTLQFASSVAF